MPYRFLRGDGSVEAGLRRIAAEQVDRALAALGAAGEARPQAVHDVRKACKKLRGLVRIVRPSFGGYARENAAFREIARPFGSVRDAKVLQDTFDAVVANFAGEIDEAAVAPVRAALAGQRHFGLAEGEMDALFADARERLLAARERIAGWTLEREGWNALGPAIGRTYGRARKAQVRAADKPTAERHHDWRKRVKDHWYHTRLMRELSPERMKQRAGQAHALAELLGDHHDCHVLEERLAAEPQAFGGDEAAGLVARLAGRRRAQLEKQAHRLGRQLLADDAGSLLARWESRWEARREEGGTPQAAAAG